jgi:hypothetical protein
MRCLGDTRKLTHPRYFRFVPASIGVNCLAFERKLPEAFVSSGKSYGHARLPVKPPSSASKVPPGRHGHYEHLIHCDQL